MSDKTYILVNGKKQELKGEALQDFEVFRKEQAELDKRIEAEQQAKEAARESAMAKLKALGLTDDEISALVP